MLAANFDLSPPDPIPAILASPAFAEAAHWIAARPAAKDSLISFNAQALLYCLIRAMRPQLSIEIGTYLASTSEVMATATLQNGSGEFHTVDPFGEGRATPIFARWPKELKRVTSLHLVDSMMYFEKLIREGRRADLIFIDGNHEFEFALFDIRVAARIIMPGGFVLVDNISQPGPFLAAREFMSRMAAKGWIECGHSLSAKSSLAFDKGRSTIAGTDFVILRAPHSIAVGAEPTSFGTLDWPERASRLRLKVRSEPGALEAQFILRTFGTEPQERPTSDRIVIDRSGRIDVPIDFSLKVDPPGSRRTIETWLTWIGPGQLQLDEFPAVV